MPDLIPWRKQLERELSQVRQDMDKLFDRFFERRQFGSRLEEKGWIPSADLSETPKELLVRVELPGMDIKEIDISLTGNLLIVKGERKHEREEKKENFHLVERSSGSFSRSIQLPAEVNADKIKATYKDGVLSLSMLKTKAEAVKKIEVKAA